MSDALRFLLDDQASRLERVERDHHSTASLLPSIQRAMEESAALIRTYAQTIVVQTEKIRDMAERIKSLEDLVSRDGPEGSLVSRVREHGKAIAAIFDREQKRDTHDADMKKFQQQQVWGMIGAIVASVVAAAVTIFWGK